MHKLLTRILTRSFPGNRDQISGPETNQVSGSVNPSDQLSYQSRAFSLWMEQLKPGARVLDLGSASSDSISFLSSRNTRLCIVDLELPADNLSHQLASFDEDDLFDGVLCWDMPNYFDHQQTAFFGKWLNDHTKPGAALHLLLATRTPYHSLPTTFGIINETELRYTQNGLPERNDLINGGKLKSLWPDFEFNRSFLLQNGNQEFILNRKQS